MPVLDDIQLIAFKFGGREDFNAARRRYIERQAEYALHRQQIRYVNHRLET